MLDVERADPALRAVRLAILEAPADDTPRMAYADRLLELDTPGAAARSEFIQLQLDSARVGCLTTGGVGRRCYGCTECARFQLIRVRENRLLRAFPEPGAVAAPPAFLPSSHFDIWGPDRTGSLPAGRWRVVSFLPATYPSGVYPPHLSDAAPDGPALRYHLDVPPAGRPAVVVAWHRGFVHAVQCRLPEFFGQYCTVCDGDGRYYRHHELGGPDTVDCDRCQGSGPVGGWAASLAAHPVESVWLSDRRPVPPNGWFHVSPGTSVSVPPTDMCSNELPDWLWRRAEFTHTVGTPEARLAAACLDYVALQRARRLAAGTLFDPYDPWAEAAAGPTDAALLRWGRPAPE